MRYSDCMSLAANIRNRRLEKRLNQSELAERSGITQAQISRLESGREENTTLQSLRGLARALGCSVVDLLPEEDRRSRSASDQETTLDALGRRVAVLEKKLAKVHLADRA